MESSSGSDLSPLQRDLLGAFFERERGFFVTGGAALAGYYLHHRVTDDIDLFTVDDEAFERGPHAPKNAISSTSSSSSGPAIASRTHWPPPCRRTAGARRPRLPGSYRNGSSPSSQRCRVA